LQHGHCLVAKPLSRWTVLDKEAAEIANTKRRYLLPATCCLLPAACCLLPLQNEKGGREAALFKISD